MKLWNLLKLQEINVKLICPKNELFFFDFCFFPSSFLVFWNSNEKSTKKCESALKVS